MALYLYNNMAVCYGATGKLDSARYFVEKGIAAYEEQMKEQRKKYLERMAIKMKMQLVPIN